MKTYKTLKSKLLSDKDVKKAYSELGPEFIIIQKMIQRRIKQGISQNQLAEIIGTKQSAISRFESGNYNPSMSFLFKVADALDAKLTVKVS